jgi:hypothetical protein
LFKVEILSKFLRKEAIQMASLDAAKALFCKNRSDSFAAADDISDSISLCKWRADSFAAAEAIESMPTETSAEKEIERGMRVAATSSSSSTSSNTNTNTRSVASSYRQEAAYLEALRAGSATFDEAPPPISTRPGLKQRPPTDKARLRSRQSLGASAGTAATKADSRDLERLEAMQLASQEAAIRESLEREMAVACNASQQSQQSSASSGSVLPPSPARGRGSAQPLQQSGRRSMTPRTRASLHIPQPHKRQQGAPLMAVPVSPSFSAPLASPRGQRAASVGADSFRQVAESAKVAIDSFRAAESFRQASMSPRQQQRSQSFGQTVVRSPSHGQLDSHLVSRQSSPACRSGSFGIRMPQSPLRAAQVPLVPMQPPVPNTAAMQRAATLVEEQAQAEFSCFVIQSFTEVIS